MNRLCEVISERSLRFFKFKDSEKLEIDSVVDEHFISRKQKKIPMNLFIDLNTSDPFEPFVFVGQEPIYLLSMQDPHTELLGLLECLIVTV